MSLSADRRCACAEFFGLAVAPRRTPRESGQRTARMLDPPHGSNCLIHPRPRFVVQWMGETPTPRRAPAGNRCLSLSRRCIANVASRRRHGGSHLGLLNPMAPQRPCQEYVAQEDDGQKRRPDQPPSRGLRQRDIDAATRNEGQPGRLHCKDERLFRLGLSTRKAYRRPGLGRRDERPGNHEE